MRTLGSLLICPLVVFLIIGCTSHARETGLHAAYVTVTAAGDELNKFDHSHAEEIIADAKAHGATGDEARAKVSEWHAKTDRADATVVAAVYAIAAAAGVEDQTTIANALSAVTAAVALVQQIKIEAKGSGAP